MYAIQIQSEALFKVVKDQWSYFAEHVLDYDGILDDEELDILVRSMIISCDRPVVPKAIKKIIAKLRRTYPDVEQFESWMDFREMFINDIIKRIIPLELSSLNVNSEVLFKFMFDEWKNHYETQFDYNKILDNDELELLLKSMITECNTSVIPESIQNSMMKLNRNYPEFGDYQNWDSFQELFTLMISDVVFSNMQMI